LEMSSKVNEAYALFQNQHDTLAYILKIKGVVVEGEKYQLPPDFLMEVMELNENLNDDVVANLQKEISLPVAQLLNLTDVSLITDAEWQQLKLYYYQEKYINRLIQRNNGVEWFD
jgi:molecular chaperone HscB